MDHVASFALAVDDHAGPRFDHVVESVATLLERRYPSFRENRVVEGRTAQDVATDAVTDTWASHRFCDVPPEHVVRAAFCQAVDTLRKRHRREGVLTRFVNWYVGTLDREIVRGALEREHGRLGPSGAAE